MSETRDLLIEVGTEELPPKALKGLSEAFSSALCCGLEQRHLNYNIAIPYATPRRLAVLLKGVEEKQADREIERRGPPVTAAFKPDGQPTPAALGFARSCGVEIEQLEKLQTDKGTWLAYHTVEPGQMTAQLIPEILTEALAALPIPKRMRWGNLSYEFVRPVHWAVILFGEAVIETELLGVHSGRETRGHRFHHPDPIVLTAPGEYAKTLEDVGQVIPGFAVRRQRVQILVEQAAEELNASAVLDDALLDEVTSLVEWPVAITGAFAERFLDVPAEALIATMKNHQKCFHVVDGAGRLLPRFIAISNISSRQPDLVRAGYERVIRPRLSDAAFFWQQDRNHTLESRLNNLKTVTFQSQLGSLYDRAKRVAKIAGLIAKLLGAEELQGIRAAQLAKCDLITDMVGEFPELQGIMGAYYARHDGETEEVATALREHYMPRFWQDDLPASMLGQALAIADRLDTLVSIFGIGQAPTGDKDPFGLRRAALGVLRILIEAQLPLDVYQLLMDTQAAYAPGVLDQQTHQQVFEFMLERLRGLYQDQGIPYDSIEAVLVCRPSIPLDIEHRIRSLEAFRHLPDMVSLASTNKRIHNILKKNKEPVPDLPDPTYFKTAMERQLYDAMEAVQTAIVPLLKQDDHQSILHHLATLREPVDNFFDNVMVMDEDEKVRANRLAFLQQVRHLFLHVADISCLQI